MQARRVLKHTYPFAITVCNAHPSSFFGPPGGPKTGPHPSVRQLEYRIRANPFRDHGRNTLVCFAVTPKPRDGEKNLKASCRFELRSPDSGPKQGRRTHPAANQACDVGDGSHARARRTHPMTRQLKIRTKTIRTCATNRSAELCGFSGGPSVATPEL